MTASSTFMASSGDGYELQMGAPRRFVWNPALKIAGRSRARWACGQAAFEPVHMSTGRYLESLS